MDQSSLDGGVGEIKKANADEFIHIFVNQSDKLTEFLEHMIKVIIKGITILVYLFFIEEVSYK